MESEWREVEKQDQARIECGDCGKPATLCEHNHWHAGGINGISFWYYCQPCAVERGFNASGIEGNLECSLNFSSPPCIP